MRGTVKESDTRAYDRLCTTGILLETATPPRNSYTIEGAPSIEAYSNFIKFDQHRDLLDLDREYDRLDRLGLGGYPRGNAEREYNTAWLAYFNAVHQLIENAKKQRAEERFRNRAKMPQPEVPDHLV